jgi:hypothetical protein
MRNPSIFRSAGPAARSLPSSFRTLLGEGKPLYVRARARRNDSPDDPELKSDETENFPVIEFDSRAV